MTRASASSGALSAALSAALSPAVSAALVVLVLAAPLTGLAQGDASIGVEQLRRIPVPEPMTIRPRDYAAYGSLIGATLLGLLYLYRGRPFIVYWIGGWLLTAASMSGRAAGGDDPRAFALSVGALLGFWSAGLFLLAPAAFPDTRIRWNGPLKVAAASAIWFLASPLIIPVRVVLATGYLGVAFLLVAGAVRYLGLARATKYIGAYVIGGGIFFLALSNLAGAALMLDVVIDPRDFNSILGFNILMSIFVALGMHVVVFEDMTTELRRTNHDLEAANEEVRRLAITDSLTGCYNRRFFDQIERREIQRHRRYASPLSVLFVDIDRFKHLNDTMGHDTGDATLRAIGELLRAHVRESDYVIRWGGDEFVLLLTCAPDQAGRKAAELKVAWEHHPAVAGLPAGVRLSIGVTEVPLDAESLSEPIKVADERMYQDKATRVAALG